MNRGKPLERKKPLTAESGLARSAPLKVTTELPRGTGLARRPPAPRGDQVPRQRSKPQGTRMAKDYIRNLRWDEPIPKGAPKRYPDRQGYIRLRWRISTTELVEILEHRLVAGRPPSHMHVHHINGVKGDNRAENLQVLTAEEHACLHAEIDPPRVYPDRTWTSPKLGKDRRGKQIGWEIVMKEDRRHARERARQETAQKGQAAVFGPRTRNCRCRRTDWAESK